MARGDTSKYSNSTYTYTRPLHERPYFHYALFLLVLLTLIISLYSLISVNKLKNISGNAAANTMSINDFLQKLTAHSEMKAYVGVSPLNIVQINSNNIANLKAQISGLDNSYIGSFIIQYQDRIVVYDYQKDELRGTVNLQKPQGQLPADFFAKLNKHSEMQGLENQQPLGGQIDAGTLSTLKQQFPDVYKDAKVGDFLLRYQTKLVIYDYYQDKIVNSVKLG